MALYVDIEKRLGTFDLKMKFEMQNEVLALLGASGSGKSMTLKCIAGIERPDKGRIVLDDHVLFDSEQHINLKPQKRSVGYLFQQYALFPNMSVYQNIACGIKGAVKRGTADSGIAAGGTAGKSEKEKMVRDIIDMMHLNGLEDKKPRQISGGEQQRVALARILVNHPDALLLDEPFSALDASLRKNLVRETYKLMKDYGKSVIFVTHDQKEAFRLSESVALLDKGVITRTGKRDEIFELVMQENVRIRGDITDDGID
ncbi:MAG: ATP-binding cassette domain-containing protein [Lachnospiraceae bacterium]|nr:ATP-binding cassette domain-containing protein [Lachnospiraceae bacterium]